MTKHRSQTGFTLIEVLVALLVFALIGTAASQVSSQYISSYERIRDKTFATWIADNRINEVRLADSFPSVSDNTDDLDYGPFRWRVLTSVKSTGNPSIRRVDVTVFKFQTEGSDPIEIYTLPGFIGEPK